MTDTRSLLRIILVVFALLALGTGIVFVNRGATSSTDATPDMNPQYPESAGNPDENDHASLSLRINDDPYLLEEEININHVSPLYEQIKRLKQEEKKIR